MVWFWSHTHTIHCHCLISTMGRVLRSNWSADNGAGRQKCDKPLIALFALCLLSFSLILMIVTRRIDMKWVEASFSFSYFFWRETVSGQQFNLIQSRLINSVFIPRLISNWELSNQLQSPENWTGTVRRVLEKLSPFVRREANWVGNQSNSNSPVSLDFSISQTFAS